ncbi:MAG: hypothetical protein FWD33_03390 [Alphaproteobacteria bacterium]|nr:hypothetical protein [Alphaproteobacteria bacterium]
MKFESVLMGSELFIRGFLSSAIGGPVQCFFEGHRVASKGANSKLSVVENMVYDLNPTYESVAWCIGIGVGTLAVLPLSLAAGPAGRFCGGVQKAVTGMVMG